MSETYKRIQQEAKGPGVAEWKRADEARAGLTELYQRLQDDPRITDLPRLERAWERYEAVKPQVEADSAKARELSVRSARTAERLSIPMPESESLTTTDIEKLLLRQGEQSRIYRHLDRLENARGPLKRKPIQALEVEYARGLEIGGPRGGAICRAVEEIARDTGVDIEAIVDPHRKDSHRRALEDAQNAEMRLQLVGKSVSEPPFPHPDKLGRGRKDVGIYRGMQKAFMANDRAALAKVLQGRRRPSWK